MDLPFPKFSDIFLPISVLLYASLAFQAQCLVYVQPGLKLKNFALCEQISLFGKDLRTNIFLYCAD